MGQLLLKNNFFLFVVILIVLYLYGCEKNYSTVVDSASSAPFIQNANFSVSVVNTDTINLAGHSVRSSDDTITISGVAQVRIDSAANGMNVSLVGYSVTNFNFSSSLTEGTLHDDGIPPDTKAHDNVYSGYVKFQIQRDFVGAFSINLWSESTAGYLSNTLILPVQIVRLNHPPVISDLFAPDTINLARINTFEISVKVIDPDGQNDIKSVSRFTPSGKVLPLQASNDSTYEEIVSLTPPPDLGSYLFRFRAVDRSNDSSNVLTHTIVIVNTTVPPQ